MRVPQMKGQGREKGRGSGMDSLPSGQAVKAAGGASVQAGACQPQGGAKQGKADS